MTDLFERAEKQNYIRGHAMDRAPSGKKWKNLQCGPCGHAIARTMCLICLTPLCKRHTMIVNKNPYCKTHAPGYQ